MINDIQNWLIQNPNIADLLEVLGVILLALVSFVVTYRLLLRGLIHLAGRTETQYDDIVLARLRPRRFSLIAPLLVIYYFASLAPDPDVERVIRKSVLFIILWLLVLTFNSLLDAINDIYEAREEFAGVAIKGYLDLVKIVAYIVGFILSFSLFTGESPIALLAGLGAITAVLLLIFRDTILSLVASVQISANDLIHEGDWIEVPDFGADGEVIDISLHQIKIQNWDKTITIVPTHKVLEVAYKNWRGMSESGGRRIKRAIYLDMTSIRFCDQTMLERFKKIDLVKDFLEDKLEQIEQWRADYKQANEAEPLLMPRITNVRVFHAYVETFLHQHPRIREDMTLLVRQLAAGRDGLPIEIYVFTNTTVWAEYESIQADIFDHFLAVLPEFNLQVFQEPTGRDFKFLFSEIPAPAAGD
jgi:miniconductance mechanosensitive channel